VALVNHRGDKVLVKVKPDLHQLLTHVIDVTNLCYIRQGGYAIVVVCLSVCLLVTLRKNFPTGLHEIFMIVWQWAAKQTITFWWRSGSRQPKFNHQWFRKEMETNLCA